MTIKPAPVSDIRVRRTLGKLAPFEPLQDHEWAKFDALVDEVVAMLRRERGDVPVDAMSFEGDPLCGHID